VLREIISDAWIAELFSGGEAAGREHSDIGDLRAELEQWNAHLAGAASLSGTKLDDRDSAIWLAAVRISVESAPPDQELLVHIVQSRLLFGLMGLNLAGRAETILALTR
jgi:hypothetical protein